MHNIICTACFIIFLGMNTAYGFDSIQRYIPNAETVGSGRLSIMFWDVYDAHLYAPNGDWHPQNPFALRLSYLRAIEGKKIADRSTAEIRDQGFTNEVKLADWHSQMMKIFPNVDSNTSLTGVLTQHRETIFLSGNQEIGRINDPEFGDYFFDIWLGQKTKLPDLKQQLLGQL